MEKWRADGAVRFCPETTHRMLFRAVLISATLDPALFLSPTFGGPDAVSGVRVAGVPHKLCRHRPHDVIPYWQSINPNAQDILRMFVDYSDQLHNAKSSQRGLLPIYVIKTLDWCRAKTVWQIT